MVKSVVLMAAALSGLVFATPSLSSALTVAQGATPLPELVLSDKHGDQSDHLAPDQESDEVGVFHGGELKPLPEPQGP